MASKPFRRQAILDRETVNCIEAFMERLSQSEHSGKWTNLTSSPCGAPGSDPPAPVDILCGTLRPLRWSAHCVVYHYEHFGPCVRDVAEDKRFEMDVIVQTTRGSWEYAGRRGRTRVDGRTLVAGVRGAGYGCRHDPKAPDSNLIASLRPGAVDGDEPLFRDDVVRQTSAPGLEWAVEAGDFETFDSRVFETFDAVSASSRHGERAPHRGRLRAERAKRFIERHALEPIALGDIAASVGLSPVVCLRQFKAHTGVTPHAYRNRLRAREAGRLLAATDRPVATVGAAVGIEDPFYFARWFARATGTTPSEYRRAHR
jgi:AraC-like DNA-binding protein